MITVWISHVQDVIHSFEKSQCGFGTKENCISTCMHVTEWNMRQIGINLPGFYVNYVKNFVHTHKNCIKIDNQYSNQDLYLDSIWIYVIKYLLPVVLILKPIKNAHIVYVWVTNTHLFT